MRRNVEHPLQRPRWRSFSRQQLVFRPEKNIKRFYSVLFFYRKFFYLPFQCHPCSGVWAPVCPPSIAPCSVALSLTLACSAAVAGHHCTSGDRDDLVAYWRQPFADLATTLAVVVPDFVPAVFFFNGFYYIIISRIKNVFFFTLLPLSLCQCPVCWAFGQLWNRLLDSSVVGQSLVRSCSRRVSLPVAASCLIWSLESPSKSSRHSVVDESQNV